MRVMLLAAGKGERMRPLTLQRPKPLLEVAGKALIDYHLERFSAAGITEVVINTSWLGEQIQAHCGNGSLWNLAIRYSPEESLLETAGGIIQALPYLGDDPFLVVNADVWTDVNIETFARSVLRPGEARLLLVDNPPQHPEGDFSLCGEHIVEREDKTLTFAGLGLYHPQFFAEQEPGPRPLLPLLQRAIAERRLLGEKHNGVWVDVGTPERLAALNHRLP